MNTHLPLQDIQISPSNDQTTPSETSSTTAHTKNTVQTLIDTQSFQKNPHEIEFQTLEQKAITYLEKKLMEIPYFYKQKLRSKEDIDSIRDQKTSMQYWEYFTKNSHGLILPLMRSHVCKIYKTILAHRGEALPTSEPVFAEESEKLCYIGRIARLDKTQISPEDIYVLQHAMIFASAFLEYSCEYAPPMVDGHPYDELLYRFRRAIRDTERPVGAYEILLKYMQDTRNIKSMLEHTERSYQYNTRQADPIYRRKYPEMDFLMTASQLQKEYLYRMYGGIFAPTPETQILWERMEQ